MCGNVMVVVRYAGFSQKTTRTTSFISRIASSTVAYPKEFSTSGMPSLVDATLGKDKWWIMQNSFDCFLGARPNGETRKLLNGGEIKGPRSLPAPNSFCSSAGFSKADRKFRAWNEYSAPWKWTLLKKYVFLQNKYCKFLQKSYCNWKLQ